MSEDKPKKVEKQDSNTEQVPAKKGDDTKNEAENEKDTFAIGEV